MIIHQAQVLRGIAPNRFLFLVRCGKGTYIRALCNDVGKELGCPSYLSFLLRTEVGVFNLKNGHTLDEIRRYKERDAIDAFILPADYAVMHLPKIALAGSAQERLRHGAPVSRREVLCDDSQGQEQISRIYIEGRFVGLGMIARDGIRMNKVILEDHHENLG